MTYYPQHYIRLDDDTPAAQAALAAARLRKIQNFAGQARRIGIETGGVLFLLFAGHSDEICGVFESRGLLPERSSNARQTHQGNLFDWSLPRKVDHNDVGKTMAHGRLVLGQADIVRVDGPDHADAGRAAVGWHALALIAIAAVVELEAHNPRANKIIKAALRANLPAENPENQKGWKPAE